MYRFLFCLLIFTSCRDNQSDYSVDILQGTWLRYESTDAREDSMIIDIRLDTAFVLYSNALSDFSIGTHKWMSITATARDVQNDIGDFTLMDLSGSGLYYNAKLFIENDSMFTLNSLDFPSAPGGRQSWRKY